MAQLTIDLAEFDKVRDEVKQKDAIIANKDAAISTLDKEIVSLKDRSRVLKITKNGGYYPYAPISINSNAILSEIKRYITRESSNYNYNSRYGGFRNEPSVTSNINLLGVSTLEEIIRNNVRTNNSLLTTDQAETREYINLEDIKEELKVLAESNVTKELADLKIKVRDSEETKALLISSNEKKLEELRKSNFDTIKKIKEENESLIDHLNKRLREALEMKAEKTQIQQLVDQIQKLEEQLEFEKSKPWYKKLFKK